MARGYDEPFTLYGLLARTVETDAARSYVTFTLDPAARFSDGKPVTAEDVIFSWQLLRDKGRPNHRTYYAKVAKAEAVGERAVRFDLAGSDDRELPLILGLMPVLAKHAVNPDTFEETSFEPPLGSGPYVVAHGRSRQERDAQAQSQLLGARSCDQPRLLEFRRDPASTIIATANAHLEAFKDGLYDVRTETDPGRWQTGYDFPAVRDGRVVKEALPTGLPKASSVLRVQHPPADVRGHPRARGDLAAVRLRMDQPQLLLRSLSAHRELFRRLRAVLARPAGGRARARAARAISRRGARRRARRHLVAAGQRRLRPRPHARCGARSTCSRRPATSCAAPSWSTRRTGKPFTFEIMVTSARRRTARAAVQPEPEARRHRGAGARRRCGAVRARRELGFDFDMIENRWDQSLSPGNEQAFYWGIGRRRRSTAAATTWASRARPSTP